MKLRLFNYVSLKRKLLTVFFLISLLIVGIGTMATLLMQDIRKQQTNIIELGAVSDAVLEAKYFLRSDMHILNEMIFAENAEDLEYWNEEHQWQIKFINDQIKKVNDTLSLSESDKYADQKLNVIHVFRDFEKKYNYEVLQIFNQAYHAKSTLLNKGTSDINAGILLYNQQVSEQGIQLIKMLDEAKDINKEILGLLESSADYRIDRAILFTILVGFAALLLSIIIALANANSIANPIVRLKRKIELLGRGEQPEHIERIKRNEIGDIARAINNLITGLKRTADFANEIGGGNYEAEFVPLSKYDVLGNSLIGMKENLKKADEEAKLRKEEDEKRNWVNNGMASMSNILYQNQNSMEEMTYQIVRFLVKYLEANQGGFFMVEETDDGEHLVLSSAYAYERRKFMERIVQPGEGLVGTCYWEKESIYLTDIPSDYIKIESGLGDSNPQSLVIVPLISDEKVQGIIEIASFNIIEDYQKELLEKVSESIAATIMSLRINKRTAELLEDSKIMREELQTREEEMRQNMGELSATQESMKEREEQLNKEIKQLRQVIEQNKLEFSS